MSRQKAFTSNFVVDETLTLLARRVSYAFAADRAEYIWASDTLTILRPSEPDERCRTRRSSDACFEPRCRPPKKSSGV